MAAVPPPPPPPPLPPPPPPGRVLRDALERAGAALGGDGGVRELLRRRRDSLTPPLKWLLFHRPAPPLIQDGPQCGLVALSMAASLLFPTHGVQLGQLVRAAQERGFTHRGEMFSAADMAALARDVFPCHPELLSGGLEGPNLPRILQHLISGLPLLVPYDEDSNHEPCQRRGHKAHWAVLTGVLLGVRTAALSPTYRPDPEIPNLFHPPASGGGELVLGGSGLRWGGPGGAVERVLVLAQQGKSPRVQLWALGGLHGSNAQLSELSPRRTRDGHRYVLPAGGLAQGLGGRALLLHPQDSPPGTPPE
ncbi:actin maturation protease [Caloenas nicobarica]|uniref:actin maturation protease n=1 Tax=Caloenas nicobarica TaxID=187106 RepID=UPI0032B7C784